MPQTHGLFDSPRRLPTLAATQDWYDQFGASGHETLSCSNCGRSIYAHYDDPQAGTGCILDENCVGFQPGRLPHAIAKHMDTDSDEAKEYIAGLSSDNSA